MIERLTSGIFFLVILAACNNGSLLDASKTSKDNEGSSSEKVESEDETVVPPTIISGSYLACSELNQDNENSLELGCQLASESGRIDLQGEVSASWSVEKTDIDETLVGVITPADAPYHIKFTLTSLDAESLKYTLETTSVRVEYRKNPIASPRSKSSLLKTAMSIAISDEVTSLDVAELEEFIGRDDIIAFYPLDECNPGDAFGIHNGQAIDSVIQEIDRYQGENGACRMTPAGRIDIPFSSEFASSKFSVSAWVLPDWTDINGFGSVVFLRGAPSLADFTISGYSLFVRNVSPNGRWVSYIAPNPQQDVTGNPWATVSIDTAQDTLWHHYALTYDGTQSILYLDGEEVERNTHGYHISHTSPISIGGGGGFNFSGVIDSVSFFRRDLGAEQIRLLAAP